MKFYERLAKYCEKEYGSLYVQPEGTGSGYNYFICPECGEPLYECDWFEDEFILLDTMICPICHKKLCSIYEI